MPSRVSSLTLPVRAASARSRSRSARTSAVDAKRASRTAGTSAAASAASASRSNAGISVVAHTSAALHPSQPDQCCHGAQDPVLVVPPALVQPLHLGTQAGGVDELEQRARPVGPEQLEQHAAALLLPRVRDPFDVGGA